MLVRNKLPKAGLIPIPNEEVSDWRPQGWTCNLVPFDRVQAVEAIIDEAHEEEAAIIVAADAYVRSLPTRKQP